MKTLNSFIFFVLFSGGLVFSQNKRSVSIEAGSVLNTMLSQKASLEEIQKKRLYDFSSSGCYVYTMMPYYQKEEVVNDVVQKTGQDYQFYNTTGFYFKLDYEKSIYAKRHFYITLPLGLVWLNEKDRYTKYYWYEGGGQNYRSEDTYNVKNNMLNLRLGISFNYQYQAIQFYGALLYHVGLYNHYSMKQNHEDGFNHYTNAYTVKMNYMRGYGMYNGYYSTSIGTNFYLRKNWSVGPCLEVYFAKGLGGPLNIPTRNYYVYTDYMLGLNRKNVWINPGFRMQFNF